MHDRDGMVHKANWRGEESVTMIILIQTPHPLNARTDTMMTREVNNTVHFPFTAMTDISIGSEILLYSSLVYWLRVEILFEFFRQDVHLQ